LAFLLVDDEDEAILETMPPGAAAVLELLLPPVFLAFDFCFKKKSFSWRITMSSSL
jgi:hypothetical protein